MNTVATPRRDASTSNMVLLIGVVLAALTEALSAGEELGFSAVELTAGNLHRRVGGYPGNDHRMPVCCEVMRKAMGTNDEILSAPPRGDGATLTIRYRLPRRR